MGTRKREMVIGWSRHGRAGEGAADVILNTSERGTINGFPSLSQTSLLDDFHDDIHSIRRIRSEISPLPPEREREREKSEGGDQITDCDRRSSRPKIVHSCAAKGGSVNDSLLSLYPQSLSQFVRFYTSTCGAQRVNSQLN